MFSGGYIDKFNGIDVVIYHIFSHEIDWLSRLDVLLKNSPKMWTVNQASSLGEKSHPLFGPG